MEDKDWKKLREEIDRETSDFKRHCGDIIGSTKNYIQDLFEVYTASNDRRKWIIGEDIATLTSLLVEIEELEAKLAKCNFA